MKTKLLLTVLAFLIWGAVKSQSCLPQGINFSTQAKIDSFSINYPGCTEIEGYVLIPGFSGISNLAGLSSLTTIGGDLSISNHDVLSNLNGLENLISIGGHFVIYNNDASTGLSGLDNLTAIEDFFVIEDNDELTNLSGLENLTTIKQGLIVSKNAILTNLIGLENVTLIEGNLFVFGNPALSSLTALENLISVEGQLVIAVNSALYELDGLGNIDYSTITELMIHDCPNLSICEVENICDFIENDGLAMISGNAPGCNSVDEVETACMAVPVEELLSEDDTPIHIYPNSTSDFIIIDKGNSQDLNIRIINNLGQPIISKTLTNQITTLDLSEYPLGIYYLTFYYNRIVNTQKIMKL
jgi:hypothetical protein